MSANATNRKAPQRIATWLALLACVVLTLSVARGYTLCLDVGGRAALEDMAHAPHLVHASADAVFSETADLLMQDPGGRCFDIGLPQAAKPDREPVPNDLAFASSDILPVLFAGILHLGAPLESRTYFGPLQQTDVNPRAVEHRSVVLLI